MELLGKVFKTANLTIEQWLWCIALGAGELIWGQVWSSRFHDSRTVVLPRPDVLMFFLVKAPFQFSTPKTLPR